MCLRSEGTRFDNDSIAHLDGGQDLSERQQKREVPGADGCGDAEGDVFVYDALVVLVVAIGLRLSHADVPVKPLAGSVGLDGTEHARLAGLLQEQLSHLFQVAVVDFLVTLEILRAFSPCELLPRAVRLGSGDDGIFDIIVSSNWDVPEVLLGGWVDAVVLGLRGPVLTVDDIEECVEFNGGEL